MICGSYAYYNICFADSEEGKERIGACRIFFLTI